MIIGFSFVQFLGEDGKWFSSCIERYCYIVCYTSREFFGWFSCEGCNLAADYPFCWTESIGEILSPKILRDHIMVADVFGQALQTTIF